jgi:ribonuclease HI
MSRSLPTREVIRVLVHADESCLGNDSSKPSPGGNAALIEAPAGDSVARWDFYEYSPQTTNNKMALAGAIATLEWLRRQWQHAGVVYVSDSQYLVKGMTEWVQGWEARGWKRKGGALENLELWQKLVQAAAPHQVAWRWIEGHAGHAKNEYANDLAVHAAERQVRSNGLVPSGFDTWLAQQRARGAYRAYDPDRDLNERLS